MNLESKARINSLISAANATTGKADTDLTSAVGALIAGFGQGGGSGGAVLLESGTITTTSSTTYIDQELSEIPDIVLLWLKTEMTASCTAGVVIAILPISILPTDIQPSGAISNFVAALRYLNGNVMNSGEMGNTSIYLSGGVPRFRFFRISGSYPFPEGDFQFETYKLWK